MKRKFEPPKQDAIKCEPLPLPCFCGAPLAVSAEHFVVVHPYPLCKTFQETEATAFLRKLREDAERKGIIPPSQDD